jgi:hypothetical protein
MRSHAARGERAICHWIAAAAIAKPGSAQDFAAFLSDEMAEWPRS